MKNNIKRWILGFIIFLAMIMIAKIFVDKRYERIKNEEECKEKEQFTAIKTLNRSIYSNAPDTLILSMNGFKGDAEYERENYLPLLGPSTFDLIKINFNKGIIRHIWGSKKTGILYEYKKDADFIKDFQVNAYLYYDGNVKESEAYKWAERGNVKLKSIVDLGNGWYKMMYIEDGGRHLNF